MSILVEGVRSLAESLRDPNGLKRSLFRSEIGEILGDETGRYFSNLYLPKAFLKFLQPVWMPAEDAEDPVAILAIEEPDKGVLRIILKSKESVFGIESRENSTTPFVVFTPGETKHIPGVFSSSYEKVEEAFIGFGRMVSGFILENQIERTPVSLSVGSLILLTVGL